MTFVDTRNGIQCSPFLVDTEPWAVWEWDLQEKNLEFLKSLDPSFFEYVAHSHAANLDGDNKQHAALALRMMYSQALEALFALLGATIQAPDCVPGWLLMYKPKKLPDFVRKITRGERLVSRLPVVPLTFEKLSEHIHQISLDDSEKKKSIQESFAATWIRFAGDFLDSESQVEYNSIKHGMRVSPGGFTLAIAREEEFCRPVPDEEFKVIGSSEFGSRYFKTENLTGVNFRIRRANRNWSPENYACGLVLIAMSMNNILCYLRNGNGDDRTANRYRWPSDMSLFDAPWQRCVGVFQSSLDTNVHAEDIQPLSKEKILAMFQGESE